MGRKADNSRSLGWAIRIGLISYGVVHLLIAWLAAHLALGSSKGSASRNGALTEVARQPLGSTLLYVMTFGFLALVIWQLIEATVGSSGEHDTKKRTLKRASSLLKVAVYATLGFSAFKVASGGGSGNGNQGKTMTAKVMNLPGGQLLVGLAGVAIAAYAAYLIYRGLSEGFKKHLSAQASRAELSETYVLFGKVGYVGKGAALLVVGGLVMWAAWTHDSNKSGGLDQALHKVLQQPYGHVMLAAVALGFACYGLFCFVRARYLKR